MLKRFFNTFIPQKKEIQVINNKQSEELQISELRYRRLFETAQDGILILDAFSGKIIDVNPFLQKLLNYSEKEFLGKRLWEIGFFKDIASFKSLFAELQAKKYLRYENLPLQTKDSRSIHVELVSNVYMVGALKVIQCNIRDITDRKKAEETIRLRTKELENLTKSQEKTKKAMLNIMEDLKKAKTVIEIEKAKDEAILTSIGDGLVVVDEEMHVAFINRTAEETVGFNNEKLLGKIWQDIIQLKTEDGIQIPINESPLFTAIHEEKKTTSASFLYTRKDATTFPVSLTVSPVKLEKKLIGAIEVFRDITKEKIIERSKSEFVSLASHQLRTPLGIIKWYIETLQNEDYFKKAPITMRKHMNQIYKSNERVLSLVHDLLSVSRIEQGRVKNTPKMFNPILVVKEIVEQMQVMAHKKKVTMHLTIQDQKVADVNIDLLRFHEVIENLISNAIEYTKTLGSVDITVNKANGTLFIIIKDTGIGMSETDQKTLFTKFFRSEKAIRHNPEGSGLGLYVARSYVEGWGGKISVESTEGKGSTFTVELPISQEKNV